MEIKSIGHRNYLLGLSKTEQKFVHEIAFAHHCTSEKIIADLTFASIANTHAQQKVDGMNKTQGVFWIENG